MDKRPRKRARLDRTDDEHFPIQRGGHDFGNINVTLNGSAPLHLGDRFEFSKQGSPQIATDGAIDKSEILLESLLFDRIDARERNVKKALPKTCQWLFQHKHFRDWESARGIDGHNGFLWIKGKPGCGKSTIMKTALERSQKHLQKQDKTKNIKQAIVHYFFNARAPASLEKSSLGLYRSLTYQLLRSCPSLRSLFTTKFAFKDPEHSEDAWTKEELQDFLCDVVISVEPMSLCVFVDALDEGEEEDDVRQLISFLVDLSERALGPDSSCQLRICLSSRHYPHIGIKKGLSLVVEDQPQHDQDIDTYIRKKLIGPNGEDKDELSAEIRRKSGSIFLWVVLVVDLLNKTDDHGSLLTDMKACLDTIPGDLNKLFKEILEKSADGIEASIALLQWVLFSRRALEPEELYLAIEHSRSPWDLTFLSPKNIRPPSTDRLSRYILNHSRGLVELTSTEPPVVQFIHETVREFLIRGDGLCSLKPALSASLEGLSHETLKTSCLRYISTSKIPDDLMSYATPRANNGRYSYLRLKDKIRKEMPFIEYAASYVFNHAEHAQRHDISQETFLRSQIDADGIWQGQNRLWWNVLERFEARKYPPDVTLLYFIAEQGHPSLLSALLRVSNTVNVKCGRYGYALHAACVAGNEQIVRSLMTNGADVNTRGKEHDHPFIAAILSKHFTLVPILQQYARPPDPILLHKPLLTMTARGSLEGVEAILKLGAELNGSNNRAETVLHMAARKSRERIIEFLLQYGANVNTQGGKYGNALQAASWSGHEKIVQMLLERGAEVNAQGGMYGNPLQAASRGGREEVVQMLLEQGAEVNAQGGLYGNALHAASWSGHEKIAQMLRDAGAVW